jgi:hypothetical protein
MFTNVVLGGGAGVIGEGIGDFGTVLRESTPGTVGGGALWLAALRNNDTGAHTVRVQAVCAASPSGYEVVGTDHLVPAGGFVRAVATCPVGKVVLGGGAGVIGEGIGEFGMMFRESAPGTMGADARSLWLVALRNNDTSAHTVRIEAVCADPLPGYVIVTSDHPVAGS